MDFISNDMPSMNNIYDSDFYSKTRNYEQELSNKAYKKSKNPYKTGVIPNASYNDIFMNTSEYENIQPNKVNSLTGKTIDIKDFKHGNMQHFLRKGVTQNTNLDNNIGLDKNVGYNSYKNKKTEIEHFFEPEKNISLIRGMENVSDFIKDRTVNTKLFNNFNPVESIRVGPGLNNGYTSQGTGGFQQADTREFALPKSRDDLRPGNDQRNSTFQIPIQAPPKGITEKRGVTTPVFKNKPETTYAQTPEHWFKGLSYLKKDASRPEENLKATSRIDTHVNYYGSTKDQFNLMNNNDDYGKKAITVYDTDKYELSQKSTPVANLTSIVKSIIAPVTDAVKITLKEFLINTPRDFGNANPQIPEQLTVYDPTDIPKTTTKETTLSEAEHRNLTGYDETYSALYDQAKTTTKETTLSEAEHLNLKGNEETYSALYDQARTTTKETTLSEAEHRNLTGYDETYSGLHDQAKTTIKETTIHDNYNNSHIRGLEAGTYKRTEEKARTTLKQTLLQTDNVRNINNVNYKSTYIYEPSNVARTTIKETIIKPSGSDYGFIGGLINGIFGGYLITNPDAKHTQRETTQNERYGIIGSKITYIPMDRKAELNAEIDGTREMILMKAGYIPNGAGKFENTSKDDINMKTKKQIDLQEHTPQTTNINKIYQSGPLHIENKSITRMANKDNNAYENRLDNVVLSSLLQNENAIKINPI
jgi:hypothetical protein